MSSNGPYLPATGRMSNTVCLAPNTTDRARARCKLGLAGQRPYVISAMGIAHGFASTVISRAESPVDADVFRQSNASLGRTFSPQSIGGMRFLGRCPRLVSRRAVGPEECHRMLRVKPHVGDGSYLQDSNEWIAFGCCVNSIGQNARTTGGAGVLPAAILREARLGRIKRTVLGVSPSFAMVGERTERFASQLSPPSGQPD